MNSVTPGQSDSPAVTIDVLRRFHFGEPTAASATSRPEGGTLPALLHPYRDAEAIRYDYPLYLAPVTDEADETVATPRPAAIERLLPGLQPLMVRDPTPLVAHACGQ